MSDGTTTDDAAIGSSLWLLPEGAACEELAARIDALALRHGSPRFPPHVTLLGGLTGDVAEVLAAAARISRSHLCAIELGDAAASAEVFVAIADALGADLSIRMHPGSGPRIRDRHQAPIVEALVRDLLEG